MPLFDFACTVCGHVFEELRKSTDQTPVHCPRCGWLAERQMSAANFRVRGASAKNGYSGDGGRR